MVEVRGIEKFAPRDFPEYISSTFFLSGCNFRCPYCHNPDLVLRPETLPAFPVDYILAYLDSRKNWLEGICVSGGEPLLDEGLKDLLNVLKERGLLVKLDTNGSVPSKLESLIRDGLVDWIAMDVKAPLERYREVSRSDVDPADIARSVEMIRNSGLKHVFRTTVVPGLIDRRDIEQICRWLEGSEIFQLQQFSPVNALELAYRMKKPNSRAGMEELAGLARPFFSEVRLEGV